MCTLERTVLQMAKLALRSLSLVFSTCRKSSMRHSRRGWCRSTTRPTCRATSGASTISTRCATPILISHKSHPHRNWSSTNSAQKHKRLCSERMNAVSTYSIIHIFQRNASSGTDKSTGSKTTKHCFTARSHLSCWSTVASTGAFSKESVTCLEIPAVKVVGSQFRDQNQSTLEWSTKDLSKTIFLLVLRSRSGRLQDGATWVNTKKVY